MFKFSYAVLLIATVFSLELKAQTPIDTIVTSDGPIVVFSNLSWSYIKDLEFDGVLNPQLEASVSACNDQLSHPWNNHKCYPSEKQNNSHLRRLKDTLWLCVVDEEHQEFEMPFDGLVTSRYGYRKGRYHNGIDIDLEVGDTVKSAWAGRVRYAQYNKGGFGNLVIIRHYNGLETFYAHLSNLMVQPNQEVKAGEAIGLGGNTGRSRGSHLHFEVRFYDAPINPEEVIDFKNQRIKKENLLLHADIFRPGAKPSDAVTKRYNSKALANSDKSNKYYRVQSGDTLSRIASRHGTSVSKLCRLNGIRASSTLNIGRTLRVY